MAESDYVIPIQTITHYEMFYTALCILEGQAMPFDAKKYLFIMNDELVFNFLESNGISVRKYITVASNASLDKVGENIKYPALVRPPKKRVIVTNKQTLKDVISLYKIGTPINQHNFLEFSLAQMMKRMIRYVEYTSSTTRNSTRD